MARLAVHRNNDGAGFLLDCQADHLAHLNTRVVVPLLPPHEAPLAGARLNPTFQVEGAPHVMVTQFIAAVPVTSLGPIAAQLSDDDYAVTNALDMLLTGV